MIRNLFLIMFMLLGSVISQAQDGKLDTALHYIPEDSTQVIVLRPAKILHSDTFEELRNNAKDTVDKLVNRFTYKYFKFGLVEFDEIDSITHAEWNIQKEVQGHRFNDYNDLLVLRTVNDNSNRFDMVTHAVNKESDYDGQSILEMKIPVYGKYKFACVLDERTIVWSQRFSPIQKAIKSGKQGPAKSEWLKAWEQKKDSHFQMFRTMEEGEPYFVPLILKKLEGLKELQFSCNFGPTTLLSALGDCKDFRTANQLANHAKSQLNQIGDQLEQRIKNGRAPNESLQIQQKLVKGTKIEQTKNRVVAQSKIQLDLKSLARPLHQIYDSEMRMFSSLNIRQQALSFHNFEECYGQFPTSVFDHKLGVKCKKYSWRIAVLPFLGRNDIYERYDFNQEWDSPHNLEVTSEMPDFFRSDMDDLDSTNTSFFMLTGPGGMFKDDQAIKFQDITDGSSNTVMLVQSRREVHWAKPEDIEVDPDNPLPDFGGFHDGGFTLVMADGSTRFVNENVSEEELRKAFSRDGGEIPARNWFELNEQEEKQPRQSP